MTQLGLVVLAVEHEAAQLADLARILRKDQRVAEVDTADNSGEAILKASHRQYDALFVDLRTPDLDGLELARRLKTLPHSPALILVSALDASADRTFVLRALDFLLKPITPQRVNEALSGVIAIPLITERPAPPVPTLPTYGRLSANDLIAVATFGGAGTRVLTSTAILYMQSAGDYVKVVTNTERFQIRSSLKRFERQLARYGFVRPHRQYIVSLARAVEMQRLPNGTGLLVLDNGDEVPVARREVAGLRRLLRA